VVRLCVTGGAASDPGDDYSSRKRAESETKGDSPRNAVARCGHAAPLVRGGSAASREEVPPRESRFRIGSEGPVTTDSSRSLWRSTSRGRRIRQENRHSFQPRAGHPLSRLLMLHNLDLAANRVESISDEARAGERTVLVNEQLFGPPVLRKVACLGLGGIG
jgi:hypothetical protein